MTLPTHSSSDVRERAIALLEQLPPEKLTAVVQLLEFLAEPLAVSSQEEALLEVIQHRFSEEVQERVNELRDRCEWDELTEDEHQELIGYEDDLEEQRVKRLEALIKLAKLRDIDLVTLNGQFKSEAQSSNAA